jgi:hypothetical protein
MPNIEKLTFALAAASVKLGSETTSEAFCQMTAIVRYSATH